MRRLSLNVSGPIHGCGETHEDADSELRTSLPHCVCWPSMWPSVTSPMMDWTLTFWVQTNSSILSCRCQIFYHNKKSSWYKAPDRTSSAISLGREEFRLLLLLRECVHTCVATAIVGKMSRPFSHSSVFKSTLLKSPDRGLISLEFSV